MEGKGAWHDNVFVERLWRTMKYERVYLQAYEAVSAARSDLDTYIDWYNRERVHSRIEDANARAGLLGVAARAGRGCLE